MNYENGKIAFTTGVDTSGLERDIKRAQNSFSDLNSNFKKECSGIDGAIKTIGTSIATVFTIQKAGEFIKKMVSVRGEIESLEKSFSILAGTVQGKNLFQEIREFAVKTPMTMPALAKGAQTLLAFNYEAKNVMPILKAIGNISMGNEEKFNSLVLAFSQMSSTGKLMGQDLLQMINAGFNPLAVISEQTGKSIGVLKEEMAAGSISADMITKAFMDATSEGGKFNGMLEQQSKGIEGSLSNLEGAIEDMFNELGEKSQDVITGSIQSITSLVQNYEKVGRVIFELIATYGIYKATVISLSAIENLRYQATLAQMAGMTKMQVITDILRAKTEALNIAMAKNPYMLVAAGVAALSIAVYKLATHQTDAEKAQKKLNEAFNESQKNIISEKAQIDNLFGRLKAAKEGTQEYESAKKTIINQYGEYLQGMSSEIQSLQDVEGAYKAVTRAIEESARARAFESYTKDIADEYADKMADIRDEVKKILEEKFGTEKGDEYFWKIVPVLEGEEKATDEINDIINQFDKKKYILSGSDSGMGVESKETTTNDLKSQMTKAAKARKVMNDAFDSAKTKFQNPQSNNNNGGSGESGGTDDTTSYGADYEKARKEWEEAKKELQKIEEDKDSFTTKQYEDAKKREEEKKKAYSNLGGDVSGKTVEKSNKIESDISEKEKNASKERQTLEKELYFQEQQNRINLETDERKRKEEQMKLDHEKEQYNLEQQKQRAIDAEIERQKAIFEAQEKNKSIKDENYTQKFFTEKDIDTSKVSDIESSYSVLFSQLKDLQEKELSDLQTEDTNAMNQYLAEYGNYLEKRQAITTLYKEKISNATTEGEKLTLASQMREELSDLDMEANKTTSAISVLFSDMANKTVADMRSIADSAEAALQFIIGGEWDETKGLGFGISKETFEVLQQSPEALERIRKGIQDVRNEADSSEGAFKKMANGLKNIFNAGDDVNKTKKALAEIESGFNEVMQVGGFLSDTLSSLGDAFGSDALSGIADGINVAMDAANSAMSGAQVGAMFGPLGAAIGGAIGLVSSLASSFAKLHDGKIQKEIDKTIGKYDDLNDKVDEYGDTADESFGAGKAAAIEQQKALKQLQIELLKTAISQEKLKKNPDDSQIEQWEKEINGLEDDINDLGEAAEDAIFGESVKTAIENFGNAIADAWANGESASEAANKYMRNMIKQTVMQAILDYTKAAGRIELIRQKIKDFLENDGIITDSEKKILEQMAQDLIEDVEAEYEWAKDLFGDEFSQDSTKKGFAAMSQDTAEELNGRFTAIQIDTNDIKAFCDTISVNTQFIVNATTAMRQNTEEIKNLSLTALDHLETISRNTYELYEMNERLGKIEQNTRNL